MRDELAEKLYGGVKADNSIREMNQWHASSMAECPRALMYKHLGVAPTQVAGAGKMIRWKAGHILETVMRPYLLSVYPDLESNQRFESEKLNFTGEYDNYTAKDKTIIEIKSVHDRAFIYRKKEHTRYDLIGGKPYNNHELQNHGYVVLMREKGIEVKHITYIYVTLDGRIATYKTDVQEDLVAKVERKLKTLNQSLVERKLPPCDCKESNEYWKSTLQYCDYRGDTCCDIKLLKGVK